MPHRLLSGDHVRKIDRVLGAVLFIAAVFSLFISWNATIRQQRAESQLRSYVVCQSKWNTFLHQAITARGESGTAATLALDNLIDATLQAKSDGEIRTALEQYKSARTLQIKTQKEHPLPPPPDQVCTLGNK